VGAAGAVRGAELLPPPPGEAAPGLLGRLAVRNHLVESGAKGGAAVSDLVLCAVRRLLGWVAWLGVLGTAVWAMQTVCAWGEAVGAVCALIANPA
jgi:hypothetical protein